MKKETKKLENNTTKTDRRNFIGKLTGVGISAVAIGLTGLPKKIAAQKLKSPDLRNIPIRGGQSFRRRASSSFKIRQNAALRAHQKTEYSHSINGDELLYPNKIASFTKTLPHNSLGEVDLNAYNSLVEAIESGDSRSFENIPLGGTRKLANPQAAHSFQLDGADSFANTMPAPPKFQSEEEAAEMAEVYWQAVTRDIPFANYSTDTTIQNAVQDLNRFARFNGVTGNSLFRGETPGDLTGPYISQFLYKDIPYGGRGFDQKYKVPLVGDDFMTSYSEWLNILNGLSPAESITFDPTPRYIINGRDLGEYVHTDFTFQSYLNAALILLQYGGEALSDSNPYRTSTTQGGFVQFGAAHILDMVTRTGLSALKAAWFQKWYLHRRLRPEVFSGRIHNHILGNADYPINEKILNSPVLTEIFNQNGSYLLPSAYPEGSPTHPAYPAGHAAIAGACVTILKAFFKEDFVLPNPVVPTSDGSSLQNYTGGNLTIGNELNKLAANISIGRDTAGVHWRSDGIEGIFLGEKVAISMLENYKETYNEEFSGFTIRKFDGTPVTVGGK